jgi:hypothetical protein
VHLVVHMCSSGEHVTMTPTRQTTMKYTTTSQTLQCTAIDDTYTDRCPHYDDTMLWSLCYVKCTFSRTAKHPKLLFSKNKRRRNFPASESPCTLVLVYMHDTIAVNVQDTESTNGGLNSWHGQIRSKEERKIEL